MFFRGWDLLCEPPRAGEKQRQDQHHGDPSSHKEQIENSGVQCQAMS